MKLGSREFIIVFGTLALLLAIFKGSSKREVVVVDQGPQYVPGPVRPVFIRPWGHGGHHHHPKPPKIPKIPIKPPKKIPKIPIKPPKVPVEPFMNSLRPPAPTIPVQPQRWF